jgi:hypothetical protein
MTHLIFSHFPILIENKRAGRVAQVVEHLPSRREARSSNPSMTTPPKQQQQKPEIRREEEIETKLLFFCFKRDSKRVLTLTFLL